MRRRDFVKYSAAAPLLTYCKEFFPQTTTPFRSDYSVKYKTLLKKDVWFNTFPSTNYCFFKHNKPPCKTGFLEKEHKGIVDLKQISFNKLYKLCKSLSIKVDTFVYANYKNFSNIMISYKGDILENYLFINGLITKKTNHIAVEKGFLKNDFWTRSQKAIWDKDYKGVCLSLI